MPYYREQRIQVPRITATRTHNSEHRVEIDWDSSDSDENISAAQRPLQVNQISSNQIFLPESINSGQNENFNQNNVIEEQEEAQVGSGNNIEQENVVASDAETIYDSDEEEVVNEREININRVNDVNERQRGINEVNDAIAHLREVFDRNNEAQRWWMDYI